MQIYKILNVEYKDNFRPLDYFEFSRQACFVKDLSVHPLCTSFHFMKSNLKKLQVVIAINVILNSIMVLIKPFIAYVYNILFFFTLSVSKFNLPHGHKQF